MKLHLPTPLRAALLATFAAVVSLGSASYASTTYDDLTTPDYFEANANVYNTGKGTFYLETPSCDLNLTLTLNLNSLADYQSVHDYANGGYYSPFVTWTYNNNPGATYGMADVARGYSGVNYDSGFTGYWAGKPWTNGGNITTDALSSFADANGNVTLTINNTPNGTTNNVVVTAVNSAGNTQTLYSANGLRSASYTSQHITAFTVNMNYVTSVTLNTASTLDSSDFTPPKDYSVPFQSQRTDGTSVGRVVFLGDSITHGVQDMSYRWDMFKTFVDNGIENEIAGPLSGYHSQPLNSDFNGDFSTSQYGGETFVNAHYAQSSGRTHNMLTASGSVNALGNSTGVNYGGVSSAKTGKDYNADTFVMMMGTNDILSDGAYNDTNMPKVTERLLGAGSVQNGVWVNANQEAALIGALGTDPATSTYVGKWGTMGQIIDNMKMDASDTMYIVSIPTWGEGRTGLNGAAPYVAEYNVKLEKWVDAYNASHTGTVKYVDVNKGLVNVTRNGQFLAPDAFFRTTGGDYIHPNEQGALIIAGNLAQGMGIGGRTAGLTRSGVGHEGHNWQSATATINLSAGQSVQAISNAFTIDGGYTIDFGATFGDGSANGWLANSNALSVFIGDGTNSGTLNISEGYISWGDKLLYCQDNHLTTNDNLRVAYTQGNTEQNIGSGYYVWLGDKLIGQALTAGTGNTTNGVTLTSTGGSSVITGLSYTNTAYAPSTNFITAYDNGLVSSDGPVTPPDVPLTPMPSGDRDVAVTPTTFEGATTVSGQYALTSTSSVSKFSGTNATWNGAVGSAHTGDVLVEVVSNKSTANLFGSVKGNVSKGTDDTGSISMVVGSNVTVGTQNYSSGTNSTAVPVAIAGAFQGSIAGTFGLELNKSTVGGDIIMGVYHAANQATVGATELTVNANATVNGNIYGGNYDGNGVVKGDAAITINGGTINGNVEGGGKGNNGTIEGNASIAINGGVISGSVTISGGTIVGNSTVTVTGNKASIGGNITVVGENGKVTLKNVEDSGYSDGFDQYEGTITATNLELDKYTADEVKAQLVGEHLHVTGNSATNVSKLNLTACDITVDAGSSLTLSGVQEYGHTTSYTGNITIAKDTTFSVASPSNGERPHDANGVEYTSGANGFLYEGYVYDVLKPTENSTGRLFDEDGQPLGLTTNLTLQGAGELEGAFFVYKADTGILSAFEKILTDTCYINTGVLVYSKEAGAYGATESLQLNNGANLVMADNLADGVNIRSNGGTLTLLDMVKLDTSRLEVDSEKSTILAGSGTFALAAGSKSLGAGLSTDAEEWKGTILMSTTAGQTIKDISAADLSALAPNADAWVEMSNVSGYFASTDQTITSNIRLMGDKALYINNGYAQTYTFTGNIAGDGVFSHSYDGNSYKFQGDISEWVGAFETSTSSQYKRATSVTMEGKATTVNAALHSNAGSALNLTLGTITNGAEGYTFNNEVSVNRLSAAGQTLILGKADDVIPGGSLTVTQEATIGKLKLSENTSATFASGATLGSLEGATGSTVTFGGTLTVTGSLSLPQLTLAEGTSAVIGGQASMNKLVAAEGSTVRFGGTSVRLSQDNAYTTSNVEAAKATLSFANGAKVRVSGSMNIGTLHADGALTVGDNRNVNYVQSALIHNLSSEEGAHLTLAAVFDTKLGTTYTLGTEDTDAETNHFDGVIEFKRNNGGDGVTQLIIADTNIAADAVIELNNANEGKKFGVGIATDLVKVEGIRDAEGSKGGLIFSGSNYNSPEATERTIEITGNGNYHTSANLGANLNVTKSGSGTQTFGGDMSAFTGTTTVTEGVVEIAHASALGDGSLSLDNGTLAVAENLTDISVSAAAGKTFTGSIRVADGSSLSLMNLTSASKVEIENLSLGTGAAFGGYNASTTLVTEEASLLVTGVLSAAEGSVLKANLVLGQNATLDFTGTNGLQMGSTVTLQSASQITLSETLRDTLSGMVRGEELVLFRGVDGFTIGGEEYDESVRYAAVDFFALDTHPYAEHFVVNYDADADGGRVSLYLATPEPTTSTLSLLALAALAARRKRK